MRIPTSVCATFLVMAATTAHAEIYVCTGKNGMTVYQNFTCDVDSIGTAPTDTPKPLLAPPPSAIRTGLKSVAEHPASKAVTRDLSSEPRIGMSTDEVKMRWGEPASTYQDELVDGRVEIWSYPGSRAVHFDPGGRVVLVEH
jgi:hypothetical protein